MELNPILTNAEQTNTEEVIEDVVETNEDASEISATDVEQKKEETKPELKEETETEQTTKKEQSKEENSAFARARREREEQERIAKAKEEARIQAILDVTGGINPYTNEKMVDADDVEEYLVMKKIDTQGENPLEKYPNAIKDLKREKDQALKKKQDEQERAKKDINEFLNNYPNVSLKDLEEDEAFNNYVEGKLGTRSLTDLYASYLGFKESIVKTQERKQKENEVIEKAKENTAVGSVTNPAPVEDDTYTLEQLKNLSPKEIDRNWAKVERSKKKLKIYY